MYHVYNRGVEKRVIFLDERDYAVFLSFLKYALLPKSTEEDEFDASLLSEAERFNMRRLNLSEDVKLTAFSLMPNHFHLLLFQNCSNGITRLMQSVATGYSVYFNKRYDRVGALFQGRYKAKEIDSDAYWQHISRYIHLNPLDLGVDYRDYPYSSFKLYMRGAHADWLDTSMILGAFRDRDQYRKFHEEYLPHHSELLDVKDMLADR